MNETGTFSISPKQAPFCQCRKEQLIQLGGEIPSGLNRRYIDSYKPSEEEQFSCSARCTCGQDHRFKVQINSLNFIIEPLERT